MNLSFFAAKPYPQRRDGHLMAGSSIIRAQQVAEYLGAKLNPTSGYENDVCVYVKPGMNNDGTPSQKFEKNSYIDAIDYTQYTDWVRTCPELKGIVASQYSYDVLKNQIPDRLVFIPQQHCNFERFTRNRKEITTVGIIGSPRSFQYPVDEIKKRMEQIGLKLMVNFDFQTRQDVVNFYKDVDIQIAWYVRNHFMKNPLKIINAASFGIPTVSNPRNNYKEVEGYYTSAESIDRLISEVEKLKNPENYETASKNLLPMAEKYHISKIAELYKQL